MNIATISIIVFLVIIASLFIFPGSETSGNGLETLFGFLWGVLQKIVTFGMLILLGIFVLPAMLIMASLYPVWHDWIKGHGKWKDNLLMLVGIIPVSILVLYGMIVMALFHQSFNDRVKDIFGLKPF